MTIYMLRNGEFRLYEFVDINLKYIGWEKIEGDVSFWVTKDPTLADITAKITNADIKVLG